MEATLSQLAPADATPLTADDVCARYAGKVCRFAAMVSPSAADAEDLAQEALMCAVRSLGSYDPKRGSLEAWLWRIVANAARDAASRNERLREVVLRLRTARQGESETVEDSVLARLRDSALHAELRRLPRRDRTLLALRYGADLDLQHVGWAVGLNADSAGRATRRALARLRARLQEVRE